METQARIETCTSPATTRTVKLKYRPAQGNLADGVVQAKVVIAADGLTHSSLSDEEQVTSQIASDSRIGLGATWSSDDGWYPPGRLTMVVGRAGYVGITWVESNRINAAAALSMASLRAGRSPGAVIVDLLHECGMRVPNGCGEATWTGTPALTRESQHWSAHRLFLVGDAAGYVEPFTGEGMSWALAGALEASRLADSGIKQWTDDLAQQWHSVWRRFVRQRQSTCRGLAWLLRRPRLAEFTLGAVRYAPWISNRIMQRVAM
jgi:flavin-dependent dehydrogenase